LVAVCLAASGGCLKVKDHLTINPDGSGTVRIEVFSAVTPESLRGSRYSSWLSNLEQGDHVIYPPLHAEHAEKLFPGKAFTVKATESEAGGNAPTLVVEVAFKDVNTLIASPYGEAHALSLRRDGDVLRFAAHSGFAGAVIASDADQMRYTARRHVHKKGDMAAEFAVSLPSAITKSDGQTKGRTATWSLARADAKDDTAKEIQLFTRPLRAACPAQGIGFTPASPPRLGLFSFNELTAGPAQGMPKPPTRQQVTASARYQPHYAKSVRAFYLPGRGPDRDEHGGTRHAIQSSGLDVVGILTLPRAYAPNRWATPTIEEARDDLGTNLLANREARAASSRRSTWDSLFRHDFGKPTTDEERHVLLFDLDAPPPEARRLAALRGAAQLEYFDNYQVIKLPTIIPLEWVRRLTPDRRWVGGVRGRNEIESPLLERLGIRVRIITVEQRTSNDRAKQRSTRFWFSVTSRDAQVVAIQPYDARGRPWPKVQWAGHFSSRVDPTHFAFPVHAEPPYSLALLVSATTVRMRVPVTLREFSLDLMREEQP
jgi:hypothetical protein